MNKRNFLIFLSFLLILGCSSRKTQQVVGEKNGHNYVDLGLSVKWATCNIGASELPEFGDYFAWGELTTKGTYSEDSCSTFADSLNDISGNPKYDVARAKWGSTWRIPTASEFEELVEKCSWVWVTLSFNRGYIITGPNGSSIFLPAAGVCIDHTLYGDDESGLYWTSSPKGFESDSTFSLQFHASEYEIVPTTRESGFSIRPVTD